MNGRSKKFEADSELVADAYNNFCRVYYPVDLASSRVGRGFALWQFIGLPSKQGPGHRGAWCFETQEQVDRLTAIAGPHYYTICKVMEANGADPSDPHKHIKRST